MKNNFKCLISAIIIVFAFASCFREYPCDATGEYYAGNETDKGIGVIFICPLNCKVHIQSDKCICDTIVYLSKNKRRLTKFCFPEFSAQDSLLTLVRHNVSLSLCREIEPYIEVWMICNLNDTTSIKKGILGHGRYFRDSDIDNFVEVLYSYDKNNSDEVHWTYKLTVTDSLLSLMEKDTSMLSLFPEYYGNSR